MRRMMMMYWCDWKRMIVLIVVVIAGGGMNGVDGGAVVSGSVYCDQCKDGHVSLFDYPLNGVKVEMLCPVGTGEMDKVREESTNMFGGYLMRFDGSPDLSACNTQVVVSSQEGWSSSCEASGGPPQSPKLIFSFFGMEVYRVDPLTSEPAEAMSFCPNSSTPMPFFQEASPCSHQYWMMPEYRCYWRVVNPDTKVGLVFGPMAAQKYGTDITLWEGLQGRADPYKTLLREAITALLNSYYTFHYPYTSLGVVQRFNLALMASPHSAILTAFRFKRANSGYTIVVDANPSCKFKSCK